MRIILHPEGAPNSIGDDTFWLWFKREFPNAVWECDNENEEDVVLQYATRGPHDGPAKSVALLWEMYPAMNACLPVKEDAWLPKIDAMLRCAASTPHKTIPTIATLAYYFDGNSNVEVLPIGIDTDLFKPLNSKKELRRKYDISEDAEVGFWCGTRHPMKGYDRLEALAKQEKDLEWVVAWKENPVSQVVLNEMMNCCDFFLSTSRLRPMFMVEYEAMAAGLPLVNAPGVVRELPEGSDRSAIFDTNWDRHGAKKLWSRYLESL